MTSLNQTPMLQRLPPELALESLSHLTVQHLEPLFLVSSHWKAFFFANESSVYRNAAVVHRFAPYPDITLSDAIALYPESSMVGVRDWKAFCKRRFQIEKAWIGRGPTLVKTYQGTGAAVHRFKVDENAAFIVSTSDDGGLLVTDIESNEVVWSLSPRYVHRYAHCEYDNGFICFDRVDGSIEVWRRSQDFDLLISPTESGPDQQQLDAAAEAAVQHGSSVGDNHFGPWALLVLPDLQAFRFIFPTLLVASVNQAFLWDVTTRRLSLTILNTQRTFILQAITYVELGEHLVFICFVGLLRVFSRHDGTPVYDLDIDDVRRDNYGLQLRLAQKRTGGNDMVLVEQPVEGRKLDFATQDTTGFFLGVQMSGSDLAILFADSVIVVIRDFERVIAGQVGRSDTSMLVSLLPPDFSSPTPASYLAFVQGKVAVASYSGIYVIALDGLENKNAHFEVGSDIIRKHSSFANVTIAAALRFESKSGLQSPSCLQVTDAALWFTWDYYGNGQKFVNEFYGVPARTTAHRVATVICIDLIQEYK